MKISFLLGLLVPASLVVCTRTSHADIIDCCGNHGDRGSNWVPLLVDPASYSAGGAAVLRMQEAAAAWTSIPQSSIQVDLLMDNITHGPNNIENEIWYVPTNAAAVFMVTAWRWSIGCGSSSVPCCSGCTAPKLLESDILIFGQNQGTNITWSTVSPIGQTKVLDTTVAVQNSPLYLINAFEHEVGHVVGMNHSPHGMMRMSSAYPAGGWSHNGALPTSPLGWDRWDAEILWPAAGLGSDYYASNTQDAWLIGNESRPLSYEPSGSTNNFYPRRDPPLPFPEPVTYTYVGDTVIYRACWGQLNNAVAPATFTARLSADKLYSVLDPVVDTWSTTLPGYAIGCANRSFVVPAGTAAGYYNILFGNGTSGDNIAVLDRQIRVY